jgi:tetratricopeptide (TPR) repeat protein
MNTVQQKWNALSSTKRLGIISGILILICLAFAIYNIVRDYQVQQLLNQSQAAIEVQDYVTSFSIATRAMQINADKSQAIFEVSKGLVASDSAFQEAKKMELGKEFLRAEELYAKVVSEDKKNYQKAQQHIPLMKTAWSQKELTQAKTYYQQKQFEKASQKIDTILAKNKSFVPAQNLQAEYRKAAEKQYQEREAKSLNSLLQKVNKKNITTARQELSGYIQEKHPAVFIKKAEEHLESLNAKASSAQNELAKMRGQERYSQAIAYVQNSFSIEQESKEQLINDLESEKVVYLERLARENKEKDELALNVAEQVLLEQLKSPGSAEILKKTILEHDTYGRRLVFFLVDAQNGFGAMMRSGFLVVVRPILEEKSASYSKFFAAQKCEREPEEHEISFMKTMNKWNENPN